MSNPSDQPRRAGALSDVLGLAGGGLLPVHEQPDAEADSVVLLDPASTRRIPPRAIVLAVGFEVAAASLAAVIRDAGIAHAAAVITKPAGISELQLRELGVEHSVTTIFAPQVADWLEIASVLQNSFNMSVVDPVASTRLGDLFAFANTIARTAGGAVAIVDAAGGILGFSSIPDQPLDDLRRQSTILMAEPDSPRTDPDYRTVYAADSCVLIPGNPGTLDRLVIAVRSGREIVGSIWVLLTSPTTRLRAEEALREMHDSAATHILYARSDRTAQDIRRGLVLTSLLSGDVPSLDSLIALKLDDCAWFRLALVLSSATSGIAERRQVRAVANWLSIMYPHAVFTEIGPHLTILFGGQTEKSWNEVEASLEQFLAGLSRPAAQVSAVTSMEVARSSSFEPELQRLQRLARITAEPAVIDNGPVIRMEEHWAKVELAILAASYTGKDAGRLQSLTAIQEYDANHGTDFWPTLRTFVQTNRDYLATAKLCNIHKNTVRYRIERIGARFGLDLARPEIFAWVAAQSYAFSGNSRPGT